MSDLGNKEIFSENLKRYMKMKGKTRNDICHALGFAYTTFTDWENGVTYPRIDKIEMLANYFGVKKSDLIEKHSEGSEIELSDVYLSFAQKAQDEGILPEDILMAIETIKRIRRE